MAYQYFRVGPKTGKTFREYDIDFAVGRGGSNRRDDVMLVQTFLHIVYHENTDPETASTLPPPVGLDEITVDGYPGPITYGYIMHFKNQARSLGHKLYPDEVMDPFRNNDPGTLTTYTKSEYAFALLLHAAFNVDDKCGLGKMDNLPEHPDTDPLLKLALTQTRKQALQYQQPAIFVPATGGG
jgi:hypothetical protein